MPTSKLRKEYVKKVQQANDILNQLRKDGYEKLTVINRSIAQYDKIVSSTDNFTLAKKLNNRSKIVAIKYLDKFINSKWVTPEGRAEILEKRIHTFMRDDSKYKYNLTRNQTLKLFDIFESKVYHQMQESKLFDSHQLVDLIKNSTKATSDDIIEGMEKIINSDDPKMDIRLRLETYIHDKISSREDTGE